MHKSINVHLGQGQDLIMGIQIYLKYKHTNENAGFYILCIDNFKYNYKFSKTVGISRDFSPRNVTDNNSPAPQRQYDAYK